MRRLVLFCIAAFCVSSHGCYTGQVAVLDQQPDARSATDSVAGPRVPVIDNRLGIPLGVEIEGGIMHVMIPFDTELPASHKLLFSTATDNQSSVLVRVLQGFRPIVVYNQPLATFEVAGIRSAPRGVPQIEVTISVNKNGSVDVDARDLTTAELGILVSEIGPEVA